MLGDYSYPHQLRTVLKTRVSENENFFFSSLAELLIVKMLELELCMQRLYKDVVSFYNFDINESNQ